MATSTLKPGRRYRVGAGTMTKESGAMPLRPDDILPRVGSTFVFGAATEVQPDALLNASSSGTITLAPLAESAVVGGSAALRRALNAAAVTAAPAGPAGGVSCLGAEVAHITVQNGAGPVDVALWGYDEVSEKWALIRDFATLGTLSAGASETNRVNLDVRGYDRLGLQVTANAGLVQVDGWIALVS